MASFTGKLELLVDDQGLSASLIFTPDGEGQEYDSAKLRDFLNERGIKYGIKKEALAQAAALYEKAESPSEAIEIAAGDPPVLSEPSRIDWDEPPLPEELAYEAARVVENAPSPAIFETRIEKVKRKRKVLKKSKIPFIAPKEVEEEIVEKREVQERVYVDPELEAYGWIEAESLLGTLHPGKPGKPGKDVYAKTISPESEEDAFHCGRGVENRKNELIAVETGFFRRGKNWIEVIPYTQHQWEVSLSKDHNTCFLDFNPGQEEAAPPAAEDIVAAALELGYPSEKLLSSHDIQLRIAAALKSGEALEKEVISVDEDSHFAVTVSDDKLKAYLSIRKHRGSGKPLVLKEVGSAITKAQLKGLDKEAVKKVILDFYRSPESELKNHLLVEGSAPEAPEDDRFSLKVTSMAEADSEAICTRARTLHEAGDFSFDSWEEFNPDQVQRMAVVKAEQLLGEIEKGKSGEAGNDVYGTKIEAAKGAEAPVKTFENIRIEKGLIVSEIDGVLSIGEVDGVTLLRVHPHRSASIHVRLAEDRMQAFLSVSAPLGTGFPVDEASIKEAVAKAGVSRGIDEEVLAALTARAEAGEEIESEVFARGQAPKDAGKVEVSFKVDFASGKGVTIAADGHADFRRQDKITSVKEGDLIAEVLMPPGESEPGWDVSGKTLNARELKQIPLEAGPNVEARDEGEGITRFYASSSGEIIKEKNRLEVKNIHPVPGDVDMKSGNIKFSGSVQVKGSVQPGFVVFSGGDVQIGGLVDSALVSSEGSIFIAHGVKGGGKAVLRSKKDIAANFIEQAQVMAVGSIRLKNSCLRSTVRCNGKLSLEGDKGNLIGGSLKTRQGAEMQNLGHPNGIETHISFGQDYLVADRIQVEEKEIAKIRENVTKIDAILQRLEHSGEKAKLARARQEKLKFLKLIEKRSLRLFTLREKFEEHYPSSITVRGTLYPGVFLESHGRYYEVNDPRKGVVVQFNPETGKIEEQPLSNSEEKSN